MITSSLLTDQSLSHGFFTRENGVSEGLYSGLNCGAGSDDYADHVRENKKIAMKQLGIEENRLATLYQVHSSDVVTISHISQISQKPKADAMVTRMPGVSLGILTADCVPILFADTKNGVIGAAHSGWKGTVTDIAANVIQTMIDEGAERDTIKAAIGPAIQQNSYEVGPEFPAPFVAMSPDYLRFFTPSEKAGHHMFDLTGFVKMQLLDQNIAGVDLIDRDTCAEEQYFFSYRRMYKRGEADYGRQLSAIALRVEAKTRS